MGRGNSGATYQADVMFVCCSIVVYLLFVLRLLVGTVYRKGGTTQNKSMDITMEEMQRELGLGVDCG